MVHGGNETWCIFHDQHCAELEFREVEGSHKEEEETNESLWKPNEISARLLDPDEVHTILQVMVMF